MKLPILLAVAVAVVALRATALAEAVWPEAVIELEQAALRDPRPGAAWAQLRNFAIGAGRYAEWRRRWETRVSDDAGAAESILLGWLDLADGHVPAARGRFERAVRIAPKNPAAWRALAEVQLRAGEASGEAHARKAAELAPDDAGRVEALRLPALIAQERGELALAWTLWKKLEGEPLAPPVRIALTPDFARTHLAKGDVDAWAAGLATAAAESADGAADFAAACLALNDPALAYRVAVGALAKDDTHGGLRTLATAAARAAGDAGEAAARIEAALGDAPGDDEIVGALEAFAQLGATEHALRLFRRHAARLAPIAARWHGLLPDFWRLGATAEMREVFAPHAAQGGWEAQLALAEMAILEKDYASAAEPLWRLFAREFDARETASVARAEGNAAAIRQRILPLTGHALASRLSEIESDLETKLKIFAPNTDDANGWNVYSLRDARDWALICLHNLAACEGGAALEKLPAQLRERTAHWPAGERLLAFAVAANPSGMLDTAEEIIARQPVPPALRSFTRAQLARLRAVPDLPGEFVARAAALAAKLGKDAAVPPAEPSGEERWQKRLEDCWNLFDKGRFAEADRQFSACLRALAEAGFGPTAADWAGFHLATAHAIGAFDKGQKQAEAAACALRWLALQTPRRTDWPAPPQPQMLWKKAAAPDTFSPMFQSARMEALFITNGGNGNYFASAGGSLPDNLLIGLHLSMLHLHTVDAALEKEVARGAQGLPAESARLLSLAGMVRKIFAENPPKAPTEMPEIFNSPDGVLARLLATSAALGSRKQAGDPPPEFPDFLTDGTPKSPVGRGAWLVARLQVASQVTPAAEVLPLAEELVKLPLDAENFAGARQALARLAADGAPDKAADFAALSVKLTRARQRGSTAEPLPGEIEDRLQALTDMAEVDEAVALARRVLAWAPAQVERSEKAQAAQRQAVATLAACGELNAWFSSVKKAAHAGALPDWQRLAEACAMILKNEAEAAREDHHPPGKAAPKDGDRLAAALRAEAHAALWEARLALVRLAPGHADHWTKLHELLSEPREGKTARPPVEIDAETMVRGAAGGLEVETAAEFIGDDLDRLAGLLARWPVRGTPPKGETYPFRVHGISLATRLWQRGRPDEALRWLRKLFEGNGVNAKGAEELRTLLLEALALRGDRRGMADVLAAALRDSVTPAGDVVAFPKLNFLGGYSYRQMPVRPLLEQAVRLGLGDDLRTEFERDDRASATDLKLFLRLQMREAAVLPEVSARLKKTMPPQLLEEFAELLAPWPGAHAPAQAALRILEPGHARQTRDERTAQLARHGALAAQCGMTNEAGRWLREAFAAQRDGRGDRPGILFDVACGLAFGPRADEAQAAAAEWAKLAGSGKWSAESFYQPLLELAEHGRAAEFHLLATALTAARPPAEHDYSGQVDDGAHLLAARAGRWATFTPVAWQKDRRDDGTSDVAWTETWSGGGARGNDRIVKAPDISAAAGGKPMRVELFCGADSDRLVRIAVLENAGPSGVWHGRLPQERGVLAVAISTDGQTVLGRAAAFGPEKNIVPPLAAQLAKLPALLWKRAEAGPDGESLCGARLAAKPMRDEALANAEIELPDGAGKDLAISGWAKGGHVDVALILPDGTRKPIVQSLGGDDPNAWRQFDFPPPAEKADRPDDATPPGARLVLIFAAGGEYSGVRVSATERKPKREANEADAQR